MSKTKWPKGAALFEYSIDCETFGVFEGVEIYPSIRAIGLSPFDGLDPQEYGIYCAPVGNGEFLKALTPEAHEMLAIAKESK